MSARLHTSVMKMQKKRWHSGLIFTTTGVFTALTNVSQVIPALAVIPTVIFKVFPYAVTLVALVFSSKKMTAPAANGIPY